MYDHNLQLKPFSDKLKYNPYCCICNLSKLGQMYYDCELWLCPLLHTGPNMVMYLPNRVLVNKDLV